MWSFLFFTRRGMKVSRLFACQGFKCFYLRRTVPSHWKWLPVCKRSLNGYRFKIPALTKKKKGRKQPCTPNNEDFSFHVPSIYHTTPHPRSISTIPRRTNSPHFHSPRFIWPNLQNLPTANFIPYKKSGRTPPSHDSKCPKHISRGMVSW